MRSLRSERTNRDSIPTIFANFIKMTLHETLWGKADTLSAFLILLMGRTFCFYQKGVTLDQLQ